MQIVQQNYVALFLILQQNYDQYKMMPMKMKVLEMKMHLKEI